MQISRRKRWQPPALGAALICALGAPTHAQRGVLVDDADSTITRDTDTRGRVPQGGLQVIIDGSLRHDEATRDGRPLAGVQRPSGGVATFVDNELLVQTDDLDLLRGIVDSVGGEIVQEARPERYEGWRGLSPTFVIRLDPTQESPDALAERLNALNEGRPGEARISTARGAGLLAIAADLARAGVNVGVNWRFTPQDIPNGFTAEGPTLGGGGTLDAFNLTYMTSGSNQDIGVDAAWQAMSAAGSFANTVTIGVIDGGFFRANNPDFPAVVDSASVDPWDDTFEEANEIDCSGGNPCPTHGADVVAGAMGLVDNGFGAAGPAGPVADAVIINRSEWLLIDSIGTVPQAAVMGADIINMSYSTGVVWWLSWTLGPFEAVTFFTREAGVLLFAAAGNNGENVDRETCFIGCWEVEWVTPCENAGVTCVGGLAGNSTNKAGFSAFGQGGGDTVDIFGPGTVQVPSDPQNGTNGVRNANGTSLASPFVAGVAALIWAADPSLSADAVESMLINNAHPSPDGQVNRIVNARGAVFEALGIPMLLDITNPLANGQIDYGFPVTFSANALDPSGTAPTVSWSANNGVGGLGTGNPLVDDAWYPLGPLTITATGLGSTGTPVTDHVQVEVVAADLRVEAEAERLNNGDLQITGEALNEGTGPSLNTVDIELDVLDANGSVVFSDTLAVAPINAGGAEPLNATLGLPAGVTAACGGEVRLHINPQGAANSNPEPYTHQWNNDLTVPIDCADLVVSQFEVPETLPPAGYIGLYAPLTLRNAGPAATPFFYHRYEVYDDLTGALLKTDNGSGHQLGGGASVSMVRYLWFPNNGSSQVTNGHQWRRYELLYRVDTTDAVTEESETNNTRSDTLVITDDDPPIISLSAPATVAVPWGQSHASVPFTVSVSDPDDPAGALGLTFSVGAGGNIANTYGGAVPYEGDIDYEVSYPWQALFNKMCYAPGATYTATRALHVSVSDGILSASDQAAVQFSLFVPDTDQTRLAWETCTGWMNGSNVPQEVPEWMRNGIPFGIDSWCWAAQPSPESDGPCTGLDAAARVIDGLWDPVDRARLQREADQQPLRRDRGLEGRMMNDELTALDRARYGARVRVPMTRMALVESLFGALARDMRTVSAGARGGRGELGMGWSARVGRGRAGAEVRLTPVLVAAPRGAHTLDGQPVMRVDNLADGEAARVVLSVDVGGDVERAQILGLTDGGVVDLTLDHDTRAGVVHGQMRDDVWGVMVSGDDL